MKNKKPSWFAPFVMVALGVDALVTGFFALTWIRMYMPWFPGILFWPIWILPPMAFTTASILPNGKAKSWFRRVGEAWFGLMVYPVMMASVALVVGLICYLFGGVLPLAPTGWVILVLSVAIYPIGIPRATKPRYVRYRIPVAKLKEPMHIALISDLHLGFFTPEFTPGRIRDMVNALKPDLVLIAGDIFDEAYSGLRKPEEAAAALAGMKSTYGTFACDGNHDAFDIRPEKEEFMAKAGIHMLRDEIFCLEDITLAGRLDYRGGARMSARELVGSAPADKPVIVLDHNPKEAEDSLYAGAAAVLCGHTHNGQTFPGNLFMKICPWNTYGCVRQYGGYSIVTSGAGVWGFPMRLGAASEVVSLTLYPRERAD